MPSNPQHWNPSSTFTFDTNTIPGQTRLTHLTQEERDRNTTMNGSPIPALNASAPSMSHVTVLNSRRVRTQQLPDNYEKLELATLDPPPQSGAGTQAVLGAADDLPPLTNIQAPDNSSFENDLSYAVGSRKAQSTLNLAYPSHLDAENCSSTTAVQAPYNSTGSPSNLSLNAGSSSIVYSPSRHKPDYQTKATSFDAQTRLPPISAWYKPCLAAPPHQEYVYPSLTSARASGNFSTGLSSNISYGTGSSSHPGTPQSSKPAKLIVPPKFSVLPESNSQTTSWSSKEYSYQPQSSASDNTQISGSVISSSSVTSGFKRRSHSPNDSEDPGPSKRHRTTQYSRTQVDTPSATSNGSMGLAGEQNQIIARQVPTTTTSSQISGDSAESTVANKHIFTLDGSSSNPTNVSPQHAQENRGMGRPNVHATGSFSGSSNFVVHNPTMVEQNIYTQSDKPPECLKWLEEYIMKGAELDSFERDPPPRCHPDTRTTLIQQAQDWFTQPPEGKRVLWLRGPAGVGKSAIIQTLAEGWREEQKLGASLFFSRERRHTDPCQVFPSLAYQIATRDASYAAYISDVMIRDPRSLAKAMNEQFRVLFIEPFSRKRIREGLEAWVITIDGLDECGDDQQTGRHSTSIHREIVQLVSNFAAQHPSVPFLWIIASRPEAHLKAVFDEEAIRNCFFDVEVPIDSDEAQRDVEKYLVSEFKKIREQYPDLIHETAWPKHRQFVKIVEASRGFFAFATVLVRFIEDPNVANPIDQLKWVMQAITRILLSRKQLINPLVVLDELYTEILEGIKPGIFQVTRQILGASMFLDQKNLHRNNWCLSLICNSLGITRDAALASLRPLYSVIKLALKHSGDTRPDFYHTSFRDFLQDPLRSRAYSIDPGLVGGDIVQQVVTWLFKNVLLSKTTLKLDDFICWRQRYRFQRDIQREIARYIVRSARDCSPLGISIKIKSTECLVSYDYFQQYLDELKPWEMIPRKPDEWKVIDKMTSDELQKRGFLTRTTFAELSCNLNSRYLYEVTNYLEFSFSSREGNSKKGKDFFLRCNEHPHPVPVIVIGTKKGSRCGLIKADDLAQIWTSKDGSSKPCVIRNL